MISVYYINKFIHQILITYCGQGLAIVWENLSELKT